MAYQTAPTAGHRPFQMQSVEQLCCILHDFLNLVRQVQVLGT